MDYKAKVPPGDLALVQFMRENYSAELLECLDKWPEYPDNWEFSDVVDAVFPEVFYEFCGT